MRFATIVIYIILICAAGLPGNSAVLNDLLIDDRNILHSRESSASPSDDHDDSQCLNCKNAKLVIHADKVYFAMYSGVELSINHSSKDCDLVGRPHRSSHHFGKVVSQIKDAFQKWDANDPDDSPRLILLSFGIIGVIGIRRTFNKRSSAEETNLRNTDISGIKTTA